MKSNFLREMSERGYINQCTDLDNLDKLMSKKSLKAYIGFDCTASSLHVGSLMQIMILRLLQKHGHQPIVLFGGGTTLIGDPSGKDTTRKIIENRKIKENISGIKKNFKKLLISKKKETKPIFVDNINWLGKLNYIKFLREIGSHFTINKMITFDSVKLRLDRQQSLSYMEFNYMILQAYDFFQLNNKYKCILQLGGSDQWGNIVNGVELIRRINKEISFGLTTPLITTASGVKMGKTEKGAVWLDEKKLSPYDYWQFWRNTDDRDVIKFLKYFTDLSLEEISKLEINEKNINNLKMILANKATELLHGERKASDAENTAVKTFEQGGIGKNLPTIKIKKQNIVSGIGILDLLSLTKIMSSKSEARRAIANNGIKINDIILSDVHKQINLSVFGENNFIKISFGKKKHFLIKIY
ncbi:MAG: tyrosine--tRNA ligase [Candidatus Pelagibacter sp.]|nr:tyrosine--tRNA ligase [Candidatus Pelagibacter sp.]OUW24682.1 MAG: tyrosine--tRNA ligase [Rickettsiales bacterium TMED174]